VFGESAYGYFSVYVCKVVVVVVVVLVGRGYVREIPAIYLNTKV